MPFWKDNIKNIESYRNTGYSSCLNVYEVNPPKKQMSSASTAMRPHVLQTYPDDYCQCTIHAGKEQNTEGSNDLIHQLRRASLPWISPATNAWQNGSGVQRPASSAQFVTNVIVSDQTKFASYQASGLSLSFDHLNSDTSHPKSHSKLLPRSNTQADLLSGVHRNDDDDDDGDGHSNRGFGFRRFGTVFSRHVAASIEKKFLTLPKRKRQALSKDVVKSGTNQTTSMSEGKDSAPLTMNLKKSGTTSNKKCRVVYSYRPRHEDELELKVDDIIEFESEVEDGWWRGTLKGKTGVFPSNFVELLGKSESSSKVINPDEEARLGDRVADKNRKNEKLREEKSFSSLVSGRISAIHQETNSLARHWPTDNNSYAGSVSSFQDKNFENESDPGAPKLPPKPTKEQCVALFRYDAVNEDELSLDEGQIINIITKEIEDKGWWRGEINGKVGVFPDNFVKPIGLEALNFNVTQEKKTKNLNGSQKTSVTLNSDSDGKSSRINLNLGRVPSISAMANQSVADKKDMKISPPDFSFSLPTSKLMLKFSPPLRSSKPLAKEKQTKNNEFKVSNVDLLDSDNDLDCVRRSTERLQHPTAERAKAPKRRPPSGILSKEGSSSSDVSDENILEFEFERTEKNFRRFSGSHLYSDSMMALLSEDKNCTMKKSIEGTTNNKKRLSVQETKSGKDLPYSQSMANNESKAKILSDKILVNGSTDKKDFEEKKKPDWLEELSRRQAGRKSSIKGDAPKSSSEKPNIPIKPSQIRDDVRKSIALQKRDQSPDKDVSLAKPSQPTIKTFQSLSPKSPAATMKSFEPISDNIPVIEMNSDSSSQQSSQLQSENEDFHETQSIRDSIPEAGTNFQDCQNLPESMITDLIIRLEQRIDGLQNDFSARLSALESQLDNERAARSITEKELLLLKETKDS